jgi:hypothetical protein
MQMAKASFAGCDEPEIMELAPVVPSEPSKKKLQADVDSRKPRSS